MPPTSGDETGEYPIPARRAVRDQEALWAQLVQLASTVEATLVTSITALVEGQGNLAATAEDEERIIDRSEVRIEQECLRILALYDLTASDLRRMVTVLKVNHDLERMADLGVRIARKARRLAVAADPVSIPDPLKVLAREVEGAVRASLDALVRGDAGTAHEVISANHRIGRAAHALERALKKSIRQDPDRTNSLLRLMTAVRHLKRIADHASRIGACVIFMKEGKIVRHGDGEAPVG